MNKELRKNEKNDLEKDFFKLMNNAVFRKTKSYGKCEKTVLSSCNNWSCYMSEPFNFNYLISESNYHTTKHFYFILLSEILFAIEIKKIMNKLFYLGLSILEISKIVMYEFCNSNVWLRETKIWRKTKIISHGYSFIAYTKREDIYANIAKYAEIRLDTWSYG